MSDIINALSVAEENSLVASRPAQDDPTGALAASRAPTQFQEDSVDSASTEKTDDDEDGPPSPTKDLKPLTRSGRSTLTQSKRPSSTDQPVLEVTKKENFPSQATELYFVSAGRVLGKRKKLRHTDMWELRTDHASAKLNERLNDAWNEVLKSGKRPSLFPVLLSVFKAQLIGALFLFLVYGVFSFAPAVILPYMVEYVTDYNIPFWYGIVYTVLAIICTLLASLCYYHSLWQGSMLGMKIRVSMMTAVYRKATRIPKSKGANSGQIVNLYAADSQLIFDGMYQIIPGLVAPLQLVGAVVFLGFIIGYFALIVVGVFLMILPITVKLGSNVAGYRRQVQSLSDVRLKLTTEFVQGIRIVKYYAWEEPFMQNIKKARNAEMKILTKLSFTRSGIVFMINASSTLALAFTLLFYGLYGPDGGITAATAFTVIAIMNVTRQPFAWSAVAYLLYSYNRASIDRVSNFLLSPEKVDYIESDPKQPEGFVQVKEATFKWNREGEPVLSGIDFQIHPGEKVMVVGKVGSGKTSLTMGILGEMPFVEGKVIVNGKIAYVPQQAWIYNATVRDNILFGNVYDAKKYARVVEAAALVPDFAQFTAGDLTEIGERGVNLSGGQKQRIAIARALYADREIYILDDPLSAVDSHVSKYLFNHVVEDYLKDKTLIMVTNQLQYLPFADRVVFLDDGKVEGFGSFTELRSSSKKFSKLMKKYGVIEQEKDKDEQEKSPSKEKQKMKDGNAQKQPVDEEKKKEDERKIKGQLIKIEEKQSGLIPLRIYWYYIKSGGLHFFWVCVSFFSCYAAVRVLDTWWLDRWTTASAAFVPSVVVSHTGNNTSNTTSSFDSNYWSETYLGWLFAECLTLFSALLVGLGTVAIYSSRNLHNSLLEKISYAVTAFYDTTPLGRILSRLSQDMTTIDYLLSIAFIVWLNNAFLLVSTLAGIGLGVWWIFVAVLPLVGCYFALQIYFRKTNIEIQRLESLSRAPAISHLTSTLTGMDTIRAFGRVDNFVKIGDSHLDHNDVEKFALKFVNMWYGQRLDLLGTAIIFFVFGGITLGRIFSHIDPGSAGIAISFTSGFTALLSAFSTYSSDLEIRMNSVERFWEYNQIAQETVSGKQEPPKEWPQRGDIRFEDFSFKYRNGPMVLKNLTLNIRARSKTAIVGRTGAGKSSLLQALYRIEEPVNGTIFIDDVDFTSIGLRDLRSKLAIIPQDPTLFMAPLRYNLDPFDEYTDEEIWSALEMVQLREVVVAFEAKLEQKCEENGSNFSVGQRQLLCMARAVLKKATILLLDEATASVDVETDAIIQSTIRKAFRNCTVLTIAHRLNTIMDSDTILVLERGELAEYDTPLHLLAKKDGIFYSMVQATGASTAEYLEKLARGTVSVLDPNFSSDSSSKGKRAETRKITKSDN